MARSSAAAVASRLPTRGSPSIACSEAPSRRPTSAHVLDRRRQDDLVPARDRAVEEAPVRRPHLVLGHALPHLVGDLEAARVELIGQLDVARVAAEHRLAAAALGGRPPAARLAGLPGGGVGAGRAPLCLRAFSRSRSAVSRSRRILAASPIVLAPPMRRTVLPPVESRPSTTLRAPLAPAPPGSTRRSGRRARRPRRFSGAQRSSSTRSSPVLDLVPVGVAVAVGVVGVAIGAEVDLLLVGQAVAARAHLAVAVGLGRVGADGELLRVGEPVAVGASCSRRLRPAAASSASGRPSSSESGSRRVAAGALLLAVREPVGIGVGVLGVAARSRSSRFEIPSPSRSDAAAGPRRARARALRAVADPHRLARPAGDAADRRVHRLGDPRPDPGGDQRADDHGRPAAGRPCTRPSRPGAASASLPDPEVFDQPAVAGADERDAHRPAPGRGGREAGRRAVAGQLDLHGGGIGDGEAERAALLAREPLDDRGEPTADGASPRTARAPCAAARRPARRHRRRRAPR